MFSDACQSRNAFENVKLITKLIKLRGRDKMDKLLAAIENKFNGERVWLGLFTERRKKSETNNKIGRVFEKKSPIQSKISNPLKISIIAYFDNFRTTFEL